jgi:hypothetical protein
MERTSTHLASALPSRRLDAYAQARLDLWRAASIELSIGPEATEVFPTARSFAHLPTLLRLALALALGLFVGLERERRGKEAGLRTFGFAALLGGLGGLLGDAYALLGLTLLGIVVVFLNWATLRAGQGLELTTSAALLAILAAGVLANAALPLALMLAASLGLAWKAGGRP